MNEINRGVRSRRDADARVAAAKAEAAARQRREQEEARRLQKLPLLPVRYRPEYEDLCRRFVRWAKQAGLRKQKVGLLGWPRKRGWLIGFYSTSGTRIVVCRGDEIPFSETIYTNFAITTDGRVLCDGEDAFVSRGGEIYADKRPPLDQLVKWIEETVYKSGSRVPFPD